MPQEIPSRQSVDRRRFASEIAPARQPVVMRGLVGRWPLAQKALESPHAAAEYLRVFSPGSEVEILAGMPETQGRLFYGEGYAGENFTRQRTSFQRALALMLEAGTVSNPPAVSLQSLPVARHLPDLELRHSLDLPPQGTPAMLRMSNAIRVPAHFDGKDDIVCVVAGRLRFTLFPPGQVANLYIGPLHATPLSVPVSLVDVEAPDLARFPRYAEALEHALVAELEPGDAIYLPGLWWYAASSLAPFNATINYAWEIAPHSDGPPFTALMHALLSVGLLPPPARDAWRQLFEHFVFHANGDPAAHLPPEVRGVLGPLDDAHRERFMHKLIQVLIGERPEPPKPDAGRPRQKP